MSVKTLLILSLIGLAAGGYYMLRPNRNVRNNNPLNIRESANWDGERLINLDKAFEEYKTPEYGFRAAYIILLQYLERGDNTIEKIITKWAPKADNNHTGNYIEYVAERMNMSEFELIEPQHLAELMQIMSDFEGGSGHFTIGQAMAGIELANQEGFVINRLGRMGYGVVA